MAILLQRLPQHAAQDARRDALDLSIDRNESIGLRSLDALERTLGVGPRELWVHNLCAALVSFQFTRGQNLAPRKELLVESAREVEPLEPEGSLSVRATGLEQEALAPANRDLACRLYLEGQSHGLPRFNAFEGGRYTAVFIGPGEEGQELTNCTQSARTQERAELGAHALDVLDGRRLPRCCRGRRGTSAGGQTRQLGAHDTHGSITKPVSELPSESRCCPRVIVAPRIA